MIGEDGDTATPSRTGTPAQASIAEEGSGDAPTVEAKEATNGTGSDTPEKMKEEGADATSGPSTPLQLPMDIRQKLRKLERLEPKYSGVT